MDNKINAQSEAKFNKMAAKTPPTPTPVSPQTKTKITVPKASTVAKGTGTILVAYGLYESTGAIANSESPLLQTGKEVTKWGTAYAAAEIGVGIGAFGGPAAPVTVPLGALIGGAIGWWVASEVVE